MPPERYLDAGPAATGGYRVSLLGAGQAAVQVLIDTPRDVAAAARLFGVAVLSEDLTIRDACRAAGVRLLVPEWRRA